MDDFNDWLDNLRDVYHEQKTWSRIAIGLIVVATLVADQVLTAIFGA